MSGKVKAYSYLICRISISYSGINFLHLLSFFAFYFVLFFLSSLSCFSFFFPDVSFLLFCSNHFSLSFSLFSLADNVG